MYLYIYICLYLLIFHEVPNHTIKSHKLITWDEKSQG